MTSATGPEQQHTRGHGHGHGHHAGHDLDWDQEADRLETEGQMAIGVIEGAARWIAELTGDHPVRRVLDIGSGPGVGSGVFAAEFATAEVEAADGSAPLLERAAERAARLGFGDRFTTRVCELPGGLDALAPADVIWASRVVHHLGDQADALARMAKLLRPGGVLAIAEGGLSRRTLPRDIGIGTPGLETRLESAFQDWFIAMRAAAPGAAATVEDWPAMLAGAGLTPCGTRSFLVDRPAPLDPATRAIVVKEWQMAAEQVGAQLAATDRATLERLLDPADPLGLHQRSDIYVLSATTVFAGRAG